VHAKAKNEPTSSRAGDPTISDCWTWTAIDADSELLVSYLVGGRDAESALMLMDDLRSRIANRVQLTTDGQRRGCRLSDAGEALRRASGFTGGSASL
jgi:transposase-like protein